jgi:hypothetical protein
MSDENEWSLSFNPVSYGELDEGELVEALHPFVISAARKSEHRYELLLDSELPKYPHMGQVITEVLFLLNEKYPDGIVFGHVVDEPEITEA